MWRKYIIATEAAAAVALAFVPEAAMAATLNNVVVSGQAEAYIYNTGYDNIQYVVDQKTGAILTLSPFATTPAGLGNSASASANIIYAPTPGVSANATASNNPDTSGFSADASANLKYQVQFDDPRVAPGALLPIFITASGNVSATDGGGASANLQIFSSTILGINELITAPSPSTGPFTFMCCSGSVIYAYNDVPINVYLSVSASAVGNSIASASIDPIFGIDPSFADADEISIETSPGIGNGPIGGVPEPSTWAMLLIGFCGLGFLAYRRKNNAVRFA